MEVPIAQAIAGGRGSTGIEDATISKHLLHNATEAWQNQHDYDTTASVLAEELPQGRSYRSHAQSTHRQQSEQEDERNSASRHRS